ncbi:MAG: hypothetical protein ACTSW1_15610 [Candidatus Hodarchaeales archaeon]
MEKIDARANVVNYKLNDDEIERYKEIIHCNTDIPIMTTRPLKRRIKTLEDKPYLSKSGKRQLRKLRVLLRDIYARERGCLFKVA